MKRMVYKCMGIAMSVSGGIIGAGFASGREIVSFFARYGFYGLFFCLLAGVGFVILCYLVFNSSKNKKRKMCEMSNEKQLKIDKNKVQNKTSTIFLFLSQLVICSAMIAGVRVVLVNFIGNGGLTDLLFILFLLLAYFVISKEKNMVHIINLILTTVLLLSILIILIFEMFLCDINLLHDTKLVWYAPMMSIFYVSMNIATVIPLLNEESEYLKNKKEMIFASFMIGGTLFIILCVICLLILFFGGNNIGSEMIMLDIADDVCSGFGFVYKILILFSIFTTLITTSRGAVKNFYPDLQFLKIKSFIVLLIAFILSFVGFSKIVDTLYPVIGFLSLILIVINSINFGKNCKNSIDYVKNR